MGKISKGILGGFNGKVGTVIGSTWRGITYMRSVPAPNKNRQFSASQVEQQSRFSVITAFLSPLRQFLEIGFKNLAKQKTGYNSALAINIKNAVTGAYPALAVDYPMVLTSRGDLPEALNVQATAGAAAELNITWVDNAGMGKAKATDELLVAVHCPLANDSVYLTGIGTRADAAYTANLPAAYSGKAVHAWVSFLAADGKEISDSTYCGPVTIV